MSQQNPFTEARLWINSALMLLLAIDPPPDQADTAIDSLNALALLFEVYAKRDGSTLDRIQANIIADDFNALPTLLPGDRCAPIRLLVSQARRIVTTGTAQGIGAEGVRP